MTEGRVDGARAKAPLARRPIVATTDRACLVQALRGAYTIRRVDFPKSDIPFLGLANRAELGAVTLHYCRYDAPIDIEFADMAGYRQFLCLSGKGEIELEHRKSDLHEYASAVAPPDSSFKVCHGEYYSNLVVEYCEKTLLQKAEMMFGEDHRPLSLVKSDVRDRGRIRRLRNLAMTLASHFTQDVDEDNLAIVELSQALCSTFLYEYADCFSGLGNHPGSSAGRASARRFQDFMDAHWDRPLTIEAVAQACGGSVRSVYSSFRQESGMSPMAYLRDVRLTHARQLLQEDQGSVIDVALRCGFASLGHFARRYRAKFAELPSQTHARGRAGRGVGGED